MISAKTKICMIIGDPIVHSLSPRMHNSVYKALGIADQFVFLGTQVSSEKLKDAAHGIRALQIHAVTVTHPHKVAVMDYLDVVDSVAEKIGAVNTIVQKDNELIGTNTDYIGVVDAIEKHVRLNGTSVAVIGAGGAARAAVYGIVEKGAKVKVFNRTVQHAKNIAENFGCEFGSLEELEEIEDMDIIVNTTSVSSGITRVLDKNYLKKTHIVFDAVYSPYETKLLQDAKSVGAQIIHGTEWLLYQGAAQFEIYTGKKAPVDVMRKAILEAL